MERLRGPPAHPSSLLDQQDSNGWTVLMWCAHWGEEDHVALLLDAGADDSLCTTKSWYNMAVEYEAGMTALQIAQRDLEAHDMLESEVIVQMLESAAIGAWSREIFEAEPQNEEQMSE